MLNNSVQTLLDSQGAALTAALLGAFLFLAVVGMICDVRERRIPNNLSLALLVGGVIFWMLVEPFPGGLRTSLAGVVVGFGIWIAFYAIGVMGAGDVKYFAALSAWMGPALSWRAALLAALIGGLLAVGFLFRDRGLARALHKIALIPFLRSVQIHQPVDFKEDIAQRQLPYGVALGLGAIIAFFLPNAVGLR
jgi:prepilin peptidase CpaA